MQGSFLDVVRADCKACGCLLGTNDDRLLTSSAFWCQQATEMSLKHYIASVEGRAPSTSDIRVLLESIANPELIFTSEVLAWVVSCADKLTEWETETRYTVGYIVTRDEVSVSLSMVRELVNCVAKMTDG